MPEHTRSASPCLPELLQLFVAIIEARDPYTSGHSQRVARYARVIAQIAGCSAFVTERTVIAALLHDVGKIHAEFTDVLNKPGRLTDVEFDIIKTHPNKSAALVSHIAGFADLIPAILAHHEAWNGTGYPRQLRGEDIPMSARIIALSDTIDAMTTSRPYRHRKTLDDVRNELRREAGQQFDPALCEQLLQPIRWAALVEEHRQATHDVAYPPVTTALVAA
jgi:HD-GYP domain-containing protein (c-di-GMP phosphodiesterase class II)